MILLDDIIAKCERVVTGMSVDSERMMENIDSQGGLIMAEKIMLELVDRGMPREQAHEELRKSSIQAIEEGLGLDVACSRNAAITVLINEEDLQAMFDPRSHLGSSEEIVNSAVSIARERCA